MLLEFRVENHRSIGDEQVVTFMPSSSLTETVDDASHAELACLPSIAIYGANASGKSNVLSALEFMQSAVVYSHRDWDPDGGVPRMPFAWGEWQSKPSTFEIEFVAAKTKYRYGFVVDNERVLEEWLYAYPAGRKQTWFERDGDKFKFTDSLKGEKKVIEEITRKNSLFVSTAVQNRLEQLLPIYSWFRSISFTRTQLPDSRFRKPSHFRRMIESRYESQRVLSIPADELTSIQSRLLNNFRKLLRESDLGVHDFRRVEREIDGAPNFYAEFQLAHAPNNDEAWLPLSEESGGTQAMFRLGLQVLGSLQQGTVLVVDELESSLHPLLAIELLKLFSNPESNPLGGQLFFTTHDTNLLGNIAGPSPLRRDQIYFTEKNPEGVSCMYPLTDFKPRKTENLERGYLQGRYGAIPFLSHFSKVGR